MDYGNDAEVSYIEANLRLRNKFYHDIPKVMEMNVDSFAAWLAALHECIAYKYAYPGEFPLPRDVTTHTIIIKNEVTPLAKKYNDPYASGATKGPVFDGFPADALPTDTVDGPNIVHHYPVQKYSSLYLREAHATLKQLTNTTETGGEMYVQKVAYLLQVLVNLHLFVNINMSLYMNIANAMLDIGGIAGMEHGILDFVAMRLQPVAFHAYFVDELHRLNDGNS